MYSHIAFHTKYNMPNTPFNLAISYTNESHCESFAQDAKMPNAIIVASTWVHAIDERRCGATKAWYEPPGIGVLSSVDRVNFRSGHWRQVESGDSTDIFV